MSTPQAPSAAETACRAKSAETTRQAMLIAARKRFAAESYENVGLRHIAGDVGVDVALVSRYFGSKEELFREVVGVARSEEILPPGLGSDAIAAYLADLLLAEDCDQNESAEQLLIMLRSASSPVASQIVRGALRNDVLLRLAEHLGGEAPEARASACMAIWMGVTVLRRVIAVEQHSTSDSDVAERLRLLFETALTDPVPSRESGKTP